MTGNHRGLPRRKSIRLKGYDYSRAGLYFVTICTQDRACLFGKIEQGEMILNDAGKMVQRQWQALIHRFDNIKLSEFIVMPNHFHGIVESVGVPLVGTRNDASRVGTRNDASRVGARNDASPGDTRNAIPHVGAHVREPPKTIVQPRQTIGRSGQTTGQPRQTTGQPRQTTGQPGQTTGQPRQKTGQPQGIAPTVGDVVGAFKSLTTNDYIRNVKRDHWEPFNRKLWQRNYYEHIIRDHESYLNIAEYIRSNPLKWREDKYYG